MKGAKGGKRDRLISLLFSKKKQKEKQEKANEKLKEKIITQKKEKSKVLESVDQIFLKGNTNTKEETIVKKTFIPKEKTQTKCPNTEIKTPITSPKETSIKTAITNKSIDNKEKPFEKDIIKPKKDKKQVTILSNKKNEPIKEKTNEVIIKGYNKKAPPNKKKELEYILYKKIQKQIKKDYSEICELEYKYKVISQKEKYNDDEKTINEIKKNLEQLIKRIEKLKEKYNDLDNISELNKIIDLDNTYIELLLSDYKKEIETKKELEVFSKSIKTDKFNSILKSIYNIEKSKESLEKSLDNKISKLEISKKEYKELEDKYLNTLNYKSDIDKFNSNISSELLDLNNKLKEAKVVNTKVETLFKYKTNYNNLFDSIILFSLSKKIPNTLVGTALKTAIITDAIIKMKNVVVKEQYEKEKVEITYKDYSTELGNSINSIDNIIGKTEKASYIIKQIKQSLELNIYETPLSNEYKELLSKVNKIDETIKSNKERLNEYKSNMEIELSNNKAKILSYGSAKK